MAFAKLGKQVIILYGYIIPLIKSLIIPLLLFFFLFFNFKENLYLLAETKYANNIDDGLSQALFTELRALGPSSSGMMERVI